MEEQEFLTIPEVARQLRVKATTVRKWIHSGILEAETIIEGNRNRYRIKKSRIEAMHGHPASRHENLHL